MTSKQNDFTLKLWNFFCSLKLTLFLLISLAVISIIGTVVPQGIPPVEYLEQISPVKQKLYENLGLFDMYHSWWFVLMLSLLTLNLICCSIKRLPYIWKIIRNPVLVLDRALEHSMAVKKSFKVYGNPADMRDKAAAFLKAEFAEPVVTEVDGVWHLFAQKHPWSRLSVYFVHLSVIVIFAGAIIGSLFGFKGFVNISEGDSASKITTQSGKEIELGFSVRCDQFTLTNYPTGAPKEFKSILTVLENGKPVQDYLHARVIVNEPLTYKGVTFYQASYGNGGNYFFRYADLEGKNIKEISVPADSEATLPDGSTMHLLEAVPDLSPYEKELSGPAARLEIHPPSGPAKIIIAYGNYPELNLREARDAKNDYVIHYRGIEEKLYTGLQVAKDPGVWVVWAGCLMMVAGIYVAFFMSHRRVWVRIEKGSVTMGGNSNKNQGAFSQKFDFLAESLEKEISREKK